MYFRYGSYRHADGEVALAGLDEFSIPTPRGEPLIIRRTMQLSIDPKADGQTSIKRKLDELRQAYRFNGRDAGFHHDSGARSAHYLVSSTSLAGVKVIQRPSFFDRDGAEYATHRTGRLVLQADYYDENAGNLLEFRESIRSQGFGGPRKRWIVTDTGPPEQYITADRTLFQTVQSGFSVGINAVPIIPAPRFPRELMDEELSGTSHDPAKVAEGLTYYRVSWNYLFVSGDRLNGLPIVR